MQPSLRHTHAADSTTSSTNAHHTPLYLSHIDKYFTATSPSPSLHHLHFLRHTVDHTPRPQVQDPPRSKLPLSFHQCVRSCPCRHAGLAFRMSPCVRNSDGSAGDPLAAFECCIHFPIFLWWPVGALSVPWRFPGGALAIPLRCSGDSLAVLW